MHHSTVMSEKPTNTCMSTESMFLLRTRPPDRSREPFTLLLSRERRLSGCAPVFGLDAGLVQRDSGAPPGNMRDATIVRDAKQKGPFRAVAAKPRQRSPHGDGNLLQQIVTV
jgi:hypothetical protein